MSLITQNNINDCCWHEFCHLDIHVSQTQSSTDHELYDIIHSSRTPLSKSHELRLLGALGQY